LYYYIILIIIYTGTYWERYRPQGALCLRPAIKGRLPFESPFMPPPLFWSPAPILDKSLSIHIGSEDGCAGRAGLFLFEQMGTFSVMEQTSKPANVLRGGGPFGPPIPPHPPPTPTPYFGGSTTRNLGSPNKASRFSVRKNSPFAV